MESEGRQRRWAKYGTEKNDEVKGIRRGSEDEEEVKWEKNGKWQRRKNGGGKGKKESKQENWRENGKGEDGREREREIGNEGYRHTGNVLTATCRRQTSWGNIQFARLRRMYKQATDVQRWKNITKSNWKHSTSTAFVEKNAMLLVSSGLSLVNSGVRVCASDSPVSDELSTCASIHRNIVNKVLWLEPDYILHTSNKHKLS